MTPVQLVPPDAASACWEWAGAISSEGYGRLNRTYAHRLAYERFVGPIPPGHLVHHLCRNRRCWNPRHLAAVTPRLNALMGTGASARNAAKTHCVHGHPLFGPNVYVRPDTGGRQCRTCRREALRRLVQRQRRAIGAAA